MGSQKLMNKKRIKRIILMVAVFIGIGSWAYGYYSVVQERNELRAQTMADDAKIKLLQKKYKEKKAVEANLMRKTRLLQGQLATATAERDKAKKVMEKEVADKTAELEAIKADLSNRVDLLEKTKTRLMADLGELKDKHKAKLVELETTTQQFEELRRLQKTTENHLDRTKLSLDRCATHNTQLSIITEELITNYSEEGVVGSIAIAEPFTQLKQVEMERIVQEYLDRIEKNQFEKRN